jgi:hypothetical protein
VSGDLTVRGGAGGVGARLQDLRTEAGVLDAAGDDVRRCSGAVAAVVLDPDVTLAALLCPAEVAAVAVAAGGATVGADGLLVVATGFETTAIVLRASATTYEVVDATQRRTLEALRDAAGFALGASLPLLAAGGGLLVTGLGVATVSDPATWPALVVAAQRVDLADAPAALLHGLHRSSWLLEGLTGMAPGMVQGSTWTIGSLLGGPAGGLLLPLVLSGGRWPTSSYEDAVGGLLHAGGLLGLLQDTGSAGAASGREVDGAHAPRSVQDVFREQRDLGDEGNEGQVQITQVTGADGTRSWIVQIPGTQEWGPVRGANPVDLTTNVRLMAGDATLLQVRVADAMRRAGVHAGEPVMLTGHSQGGIAAAALASDAAFRAEFAVRAVVTGGAPIARFAVPDDVAVLALEHRQDAVPMLDGRANPDRPGWVTVGRSLPDSGYTVADPLAPDAVLDRGPTAGDAHDTAVYADTGRLVDGSTDPGIRRWLDEQRGFFTGDAAVTRWRVTG